MKILEFSLDWYYLFITVILICIEEKDLSDLFNDSEQVMLNVLSSGINNVAKLTIITRPESDYKEKDKLAFAEMVNSIRGTGASIIFKSNIHQKFAIIDQRIVWYGSINLLSFGSAEESVMRLDSINIGNELIGTIEDML